MKHKDKFHLIVVEGPAGSGKSTFLEKLRPDLTGVATILDNSGPLFGMGGNARSFEKGADEALKHMRDIAHLMRMVYSAYYLSPDRTFIADRFMLSQLVYGSIRRENLWSQQILTRTLTSIKVQFDQLYMQVRQRDLAPIPGVPKLKIDFLILGPSVQTLEHRRASARNREYPYSAYVEVEAYRKMYFDLQSLGVRTQMRQGFGGIDFIKRLKKAQ